MITQARFSTLGLLALALSNACSSTTPPATVELPTSLTIASIDFAGTTDTWTPDNQVALPLPCEPSAPLLVGIAPPPVFNASTSTSTIDNFTLAPPGDCGTNVSCGWLKLHVTPTVGEEIDLASITSPMTVRGLSNAGSATFSLELHDSYDNPFKDSAGNPFGNEVTIDFTDPGNCPAGNTSDAGI